MEILNRILKEKQNRKLLIKEFQAQVWNNQIHNQILSDLAYDLDFYEPNDAIRIAYSEYYGDERLEQEINLVIKLLGK